MGTYYMISFNLTLWMKLYIFPSKNDVYNLLELHIN
jgi:hypothetical protein